MNDAKILIVGNLDSYTPKGAVTVNGYGIGFVINVADNQYRFVPSESFLPEKTYSSTIDLADDLRRQIYEIRMFMNKSKLSVI